MAKKSYKRLHQTIPQIIDAAAKRRVKKGLVRPPPDQLNRLHGKFLPVKIKAGKTEGKLKSLVRRAFGGISRAPEIAPAAIGVGAGVAMVVPGSERILPHTLVDKHGNRCATQKWINRAFLVIVRGPGRPADAPPKLGLGGPKFRCYYPNSTPDDMRALLGSGSSGRWLNAWGQKSNYVRF